MPMDQSDDYYKTTTALYIYILLNHNMVAAMDYIEDDVLTKGPIRISN